ncbi:MAG: hypothetical protein HS119_07785 [Flavobacteriales bacterium]|nr:hypothetical protein [Flavobacteriales bacterium]
MKKFIIKTILFLLPIFAISLSMEILLRKIPNDYLYKKEYLDKYSNEIETLILGSSHSFYGLNPDFFSSSTFNAAHISQSLNYDYEIFKKYQDNLHNLKTLILPISYFTLYGKLENGSESWRVKNYVIYYGMNVANSFVDYAEVLSNQPKVNRKKFYGYYIKSNHDQYISCSELGWGTPIQSKDLVETGKAAAERHTKADITSDFNNNIFNNNQQILNTIIKWCKKQNIKVLLLTLPAYTTYRQNINLEQYGITIKTANKIASQYDNCIYVNLFDDTNFVAKDFRDADHLSEIGAEKLSKLIDKKINEWK